MGAAGAALVIGCLLLVALFAWQVLAGGVLAQVDLRVTHWLAAHRLPWLTAAMLLVSEVHRTVGILAMAAGVAGWLLWRKHRADALFLLVVPTGMLLNVGLKNLFQRARPVLEAPLVHLTTFSFPSGHAAASTVFYGALGVLVLAHVRQPLARAAGVAVAALMVLVVCFSRVYLGAHYLTDVVAGVAVGTAWLVTLRWCMQQRKEIQ